MKKVVVTINNEQLERIKKLFDVTSKNVHNFNLTFDEFLEEFIRISFETNLQFSEMEENVAQIIRNCSESLSNNFKINDETLKDFDSIVQNIFKNNIDGKSKNQKETKSNNNKKN